MGEQSIGKYIQEHFKNLSRGLMQPSYPVAYNAYKKLYEIGPSVIPIIESKILETDWSNSKYKELSNYISGLFSLLHDLDENEAKIVIEKIDANGCPKHIKAILNSVLEFSLKNYTKYQIRGLDIFEHKLVEAKCNIPSYLEKWLNNVPEVDLKDISRLYVINRKKIDAAGAYTPVLKVIALLWDNQYRENSLPFKLFALYTEKVLYHEIGHHKNRHNFGTDPDQEKDADRYAFQIMKKCHPYLAQFSRILTKLGVKSNRNYYRWGL